MRLPEYIKRGVASIYSNIALAFAIFLCFNVKEYGAFEKRFSEQLMTGSVTQTEKGYSLTKRGSFLVCLFRFVGKWFQTDTRLLYP